MNRDSDLRRLDLLTRIRPENGSTESEAENARRLASKLIERHALDRREVETPCRKGESRLSWVYWEHIVSDYCATLNHFGTRGSVSLEGGKTMVLINLATGDWHVKRRSPSGFQIVERSSGLESFRAYMRRNAPRAYTFARG
jgi:Protein of unknown function (DUF2786)